MKGQNTTLNCDVGNIQILLRFARWKDSQRLSHVETPPNAAIISAGCEGDKNAGTSLKRGVRLCYRLSGVTADSGDHSGTVLNDIRKEGASGNVFVFRECGKTLRP